MIKTVVTADDFGFSKNINQAIIDCYEKRRVTELSLMVDCFGTEDAVEYINDKKRRNVGLHFSMVRVNKGGAVLHTQDYHQILENESEEKLAERFMEEISLFKDLVGFVPTHVIGHQQIALHPKLVKTIGDYCGANNCFARAVVKHKSLIEVTLPAGIDIGRTTEERVTFCYGSPEEMYNKFREAIAPVKSLELIFHPGYAGEFEKNLTSFIQERIDDVNFLFSDYFLKLVEELGLKLVPSSEI